MSKIFQCGYCDKVYTNRHNLSRHKKMHSNVKLRGDGIVMDYTSGARNYSKLIDQEVASSVADNDFTNCLQMDPVYADEATNSSEATTDDDEETNSSEADEDEESNSS